MSECTKAHSGTVGKCVYCERDELRDALSHIQWVKDCGIDFIDDSGKMINSAADERDAMYEIATRAIGPSREEQWRRDRAARSAPASQG